MNFLVMNFLVDITDFYAIRLYHTHEVSNINSTGYLRGNKKLFGGD
jgi:hypothetical protein